MRIRPLILPLLCMGVVAPNCSRADGNNTSTPSGYVWCDLVKLGGSALIPEGWFCSEIPVPTGFGYRITKDEVVSKSSGHQTGFTSDDNNQAYWDMNRLTSADYQTGFTIKAFFGPFWDKTRLSKLADGLIEDSKREGRVSALLVSSVGLYTTSSFNLDSIIAYRNVLESQHSVELILQDTGKPTLVRVTFDCPLRAWPQNDNYCKMFFATLSLFQSAEELNHSPYPPPASVATAVEQSPRKP